MSDLVSFFLPVIFYILLRCINSKYKVIQNYFHLIFGFIIAYQALPWLTRMLNSIEFQHISFPNWHFHGLLKLQAEILSNQWGHFLSISDYLPDRQSYIICIPEGDHSSCWSLFKKELLSFNGFTPYPPPFPNNKKRNRTLTTTMQSNPISHQSVKSALPTTENSYSDPTTSLHLFTKNI